jgi:hypothetical protein
MVKFNKSLVIFGAFCALILGLSNSGLHPVSGSSGYTGAPGDSSCAQCHTGSNANLNGSVTIDGLPSTIMTGETYPLTVTVTNPNGNAVKGGFQMVVLNGSNQNGGTLSNVSAGTQLRVAGGKTYFGHAPAPNFPGSNELSFTVDWTAPATTGAVPEMKFYACAVIANGANGNGNDRVVFASNIVPISGGAAPLLVSINNVSPVSCFGGSDGEATANPTGGTTPYNYLWSNGSTLQTNTTLSQGLATVTVTDNAGVTASASVNITSPSAIQMVTSGSTVCENASNGTVSVIASGGAGGFSYSWSTGNSGPSVSNLPAGFYTVTVTDNNSCTATGTATINESPPINITGTVEMVQCNGQSTGGVITTITGGTGNKTYLWSNGTTQQSLNNNVPAGTYTITVTDVAQCTNTASFVVTQPPVLNGTANVQNNVSCFGGNNGTATVTASGGTLPYSYNWSNGQTSTGASSTLSNLTAGNYTVTVSDAFNCQKTVNFAITQPAQITFNSSVTNVSCFGLSNGQINSGVTGAQGSVSYLWSNGETTANLNNINAGNYILTITDSQSCTSSNVYNVTQPGQIVISLTTTNVSCNNTTNGSVAALVSGGVGNKSFLWSSGQTTSTINNLSAGTYTVTVTDANNCSNTQTATVTTAPSFTISLVSSTNLVCHGDSTGAASVNQLPNTTYLWSNGATTTAINNLKAGLYNVVATDNQGCKSNKIEVTISQPEKLKANLIASDTILCPGEINAFLSVGLYGGTGQINYKWSHGDTLLLADTLKAGTYTISLTDAAACKQNYKFKVHQSDTIKLNNVKITNVKCLGDSDGAIEIAAKGGFGVLNYVWSDTLLVGDSVYQLKAGTYQVTATDVGKCSATATYTVGSVNPPIVIESITEVKPTSTTAKNGSLEANISGGTGTLKIEWFQLNQLIGTGTKIENIGAGFYNLIITDAASCTTSKNIILNSVSSTSQTDKVSVDIAPNPSNQQFVIKAGGKINTLKIYDIQGKVIINDSPQSELVTVDVTQTGLQPGMYICMMHIGDQIVSKRIVVTE